MGREPNFFLVGASRSGTTSLWQYLIQHPDVYMPTRTMAEKEPCHFCEVTPRWATKYRDRDRYLQLFAPAGDQRAVGEGSTPYLPAPEVPGRIRARYPDAKILIILRNPADRAFSLYRYLCIIGAEWISSFEKALDVEPSRMRDERFKYDNPLWYAAYQYFHSGLYSSQIERYLAAFPRPQVKIVLFDDLEARPAELMREVYAFLDVDPAFEPRIRRHNGSAFPYSVPLQYLFARGVDRGGDRAAGPVRSRLLAANMRLGRFRRRPYDPDTRRRLCDAYRDDITKVATQIGRPLDAWLGSNGAETH